MARSEFGRQIGFVESSLSSDEEEEEVARGGEERDCQDDEDNAVGQGGEAQKHLHYNRLSLISSSGSPIARLAKKTFMVGKEILQLDYQRDIAKCTMDLRH